MNRLGLTTKIYWGVIRTVDFHPFDSNLVASGGSDRKVALYSLENNEIVWGNKDMDETVMCVRFNRSGSLLAAGAWNGRLLVIHSENGKTCFEIFVGRNIRCLSFRSDEIFLGLHDGTILLVDYKSKTIERIETASRSSRAVTAMDFSPICDDLVLVGTDLGVVELINLKEEKVTILHKNRKEVINMVQFTRDGSKFLLGNTDSGCCLQSLDRKMKSMVKCEDTFAHTTFSSVIHDNELVITTSDNYTIKMWDGHTGKRIKAISTHGKPVCGAVSKNEKVIVIGCIDGSIEFFSCPSRPVYSIHKKYMISFF